MKCGNAATEVVIVNSIGNKPNLYCEAMDLVCGGSPKVCILDCRVESLAQSKVGAMAAKTSLDQLFVQYKCTVINAINDNYLQIP